MVWWPWKNTCAIKDLRCGRRVFLASSSPKMEFIVTNLGSNNLEERRPSKGFFTCATSNHIFQFNFSFASFVFVILHSIMKIWIFSICIFFLGSFTMFSSLGVWLMSSPIFYGFGEIQRWTTPCTMRISSRIGPHTILRTTTALGIIPHHLKLCSKKTMNPASKEAC